MKTSQIRFVFYLIKRSTLVLLISLNGFVLSSEAWSQSTTDNSASQTNVHHLGNNSENLNRQIVDRPSPVVTPIDSAEVGAAAETLSRPDQIYGTRAVPELSNIKPRITSASTTPIAGRRGITNPGQTLADVDDIRAANSRASNSRVNNSGVNNSRANNSRQSTQASVTPVPNVAEPKPSTPQARSAPVPSPASPALTSAALASSASTQAAHLRANSPASPIAPARSGTARSSTAQSRTAQSPTTQPPAAQPPAPVQTPAASPSADPDYIMPPQIVPDERVPPFITTMPLNGTVISHLTEWEAVSRFEFGDGRSENFGFDGILRLDSEVEQSLSRDNIFTSLQTGEYLQARTVRIEREVTVSRREPQTMTGLRIQMSLTASCLLPDQGEPDDQCTYTPGLVTDPESIDPDFFVPTRIEQTADFGDVVTPESLAAMARPGFQLGANGQEVGLDLIFPNTGAFAGNTQSTEASIDREERFEERPAGVFSRVRQVIRANDREAVLGRTIRGNVIIADLDNLLLNSAVQAVAEFLPDADPQIEGSENPANTNINRNLFLAANNTRLPEGSFTIYHAGIGRAATPVTFTSLEDLPSAHFNSIWIGLSPVTERSLSREIRYVPTGPTRITTRASGEGGVDSNVEFNSLVNEQLFSTNELEDFYTQIYLTFTRRDVDFVTSTTQTERTRFYPHISFTGNITSSNDIFRYYAGIIASDEIKAYLGLDYTYVSLSGWTFNAGAIGYLNPDRDYYSRLWGNTAYRIRFSNTANLVLSTGFVWALDQQDGIDGVTLDTQGSNVNISARANIGPVSFGVTNYFGDLLPHSIEDTLILDAGVRIGNSVYLSGYFAPIDRNSSRSRYGTKVQWRMGSDYNDPTLIFSWSNYEYDYGLDQAGNDLLVDQNVFSLQVRLGEPPNPFDPRTAEQLRQQVDQEVERFQQQRDRVDPPAG